MAVSDDMFPSLDVRDVFDSHLDSLFNSLFCTHLFTDAIVNKKACSTFLPGG